MKLTELNRNPRKILMYGEVGTGKTAAWQQLGDDVEFIETDRSHEVAFGLKDAFFTERQKIHVTPCWETDPEKIAVGFTKAKDRLLQIYNDVKEKKYARKIIVVDSITALCDMCLAYIKGNGGHINAATVTLQEWGILAGEMDRFVNLAIAIPLPVVFIGHSQKDAETKEVSLGLPGQKFPQAVPRKFDEIWYAKVVPAPGNINTYKIQTVKDALILARSRGGLENNFDMNKGMRVALEAIGQKL